MATKRPAPAQRKKASPRIAIRMYRLGVGDCFLVQLPRPGAEPFRMLIDCGVHQAQAGGAERIQDVVADVKQVTGGRLDVVVATHEHWDHLSGFHQAASTFATFTVGEIWAPWTENASDTLARDLMKKRHQAIAVLGRAETRLRLAGHDAGADRLAGLLGFFGDTTGEKLRAAGQALRALVASAKQIHYRRPGEKPIELAGGTARVFVLGPPRSAIALARSAPTKKGDEVYRFGAYGPALDALEPALTAAESAPFDSRFAIPLSGATGLPFFQRRYFAAALAEGEVAALERDVLLRDRRRGHRIETRQDWRRIDADWLDAATSLALKLDEDTNNTSLAFALELGPAHEAGPVILFAADAQVGNWLSWQRVVWKKDVHGREVSGPDLLRRTLVYKVGHHASHNATLRAQGLEQMDALALALIPTDAAMAKKVGWGTLPWKSLLDRLDEKTKHRVLRTDRPAPAKLDGFSLTAKPLYYEVAL